MSNESISAVFLGNFTLLVGKEMICILEKKLDGWMKRKRSVCDRKKKREREREREINLCSFLLISVT